MPITPIVLRHQDPWGADVTDAIKLHAMDDYPNESCGVIVDDQYVPCANIHPTPDKAFRVAPDYTSPLLAAGKIQAIVHSHPEGPSHPGVEDAQNQIDMGIPWGVVPVVGDIAAGKALYTGDILWWGDQLPTAPLLGRRFIWHIFHCYQLYRDWWWTERGIRFALYPCEEEFIVNERDVFIEHVEKTHHVNLGKIPVTELEIGDMLVGKLRGRHANHCGVYIGGDEILHHPAGGASCTTSLQRWWPYIDTVLRYDGSQNPSPSWSPRDDLRSDA